MGKLRRCMIARWLAAFLAPTLVLAEESERPYSRAGQPMVDVAKVAPRIVIELRYATGRNLAKYPIYPKNARCLLRQSVADRLIKAQQWLDANALKGTRLKIWDAWRPAWAHRRLWQIVPNKKYLADPRDGGSLHTWGVAVDATLCDADGRDLRMPTEFDVLGPDAKTVYSGPDAEIRRNLDWLQRAMTVAGFQVLHDEWWHFVARDWIAFAPTDLPLTVEAPESPSEKPLSPAPKKAALR